MATIDKLIFPISFISSLTERRRRPSAIRSFNALTGFAWTSGRIPFCYGAEESVCCWYYEHAAAGAIWGSAIAERPEILVAASGAAANAPVVWVLFPNAVSNVAPVAPVYCRKACLRWSSGTSVGILSTIGVIKLTSNNNSAKDRSSDCSARNYPSGRDGSYCPQSFTTVDQFARWRRHSRSCREISSTLLK